MGKLGVSVYPERSTYEEDAAYLDLAAKYGFKRVFTSLLEIKGQKDDVLNEFKRVIDHANSLHMQVIVDINPGLFSQLGITYDNLAFFHDLGAWGIRLDVGFNGLNEAEMTHNPYGLKIEINMSQGTKQIDNIMSFSPNRDNLLGCHNFYPHRFSGLGTSFFQDTTASFNKYDLNTAAFVNSQNATFGPWPTQDGLPTIEDHRNLSIETQVKHYILMDSINDLIIGNAYASEEELQSMHDAFTAVYPTLSVSTNKDITTLEKELLFNNQHTYRGDRSEYIIRSSEMRMKYADENIPVHNTVDIKRGDILVDNNEYGQYKAEVEIALQSMTNDGRANVVGHIDPNELFLLNYLKPWSNFYFKEHSDL
ncbi:DUF871 domain-containing protein [Companilactobacillus huachuanensis]|uniref:DUF871 domain-containing protein n=1 Tax=Companilactobacillus huachuanensis TaxID=2559914 RepID=A0ABW1RPM4_9LACO|nr:MupG family TIM beta-alpha barrel fold protein [Companilactobacillus huachuanensis]